MNFCRVRQVTIFILELLIAIFSFLSSEIKVRMLGFLCSPLLVTRLPRLVARNVILAIITIVEVIPLLAGADVSPVQSPWVGQAANTQTSALVCSAETDLQGAAGDLAQKVSSNFSDSYLHTIWTVNADVCTTPNDWSTFPIIPTGYINTVNGTPCGVDLRTNDGSSALRMASCNFTYNQTEILLSNGNTIVNANTTRDDYFFQVLRCPQGYSIANIAGANANPTCVGQDYYFLVDTNDLSLNNGQSCPAIENPINPANGNKFTDEVDYSSWSDRLRFQRFHNSQTSVSSSLGTGWRHSYNASISLTSIAALPNTLPINWSVSSAYATADQACIQGWNDIRQSIPGNWVDSATATYLPENLCRISYGDGKIWKILPIYTNTGSLITIVNVVRPDGRLVQFTNQGGSWVNESSGGDSLVELTDGSGVTTGWQYTTADNIVETYDAVGKLTAITNHADLNQTLSYDGSGNLRTVSDHFGRTLTFAYDTQNHLSTMTDPAGGTYTYSYDANDNLASVSYPDGKMRTYVYNELANTLGADMGDIPYWNH